MKVRLKRMSSNPKSGSRQFYAAHGKELSEFFMEAQRAYASGAIKPQIKADGSSCIEYADDGWHYVDLWYGGEPYSGMTVILYQGVACWSMVYWGRIMPYAGDKKAVLAALMEALSRNTNREQPWRGPHKYTASDGMRYKNTWKGGMRCFSGTEIITDRTLKETLYTATYMGGIINKD